MHGAVSFMPIVGTGGGMRHRFGIALACGESVTIAEFGTFSAKRRPARTGRNPRTGEPIANGASNTVSFKAGKAPNDSVN